MDFCGVNHDVHVSPADKQHLLVIKKEVFGLQSSSLDQQNPELHHLKKEEEGLWVSEDGEQLTVRIVDDETLKISELCHDQTEDSKETEAPTSSPAKQTETGPDGEDSGGAKRDKNPEPTGYGSEQQEVQMKHGNYQILLCLHEFLSS